MTKKESRMVRFRAPAMREVDCRVFEVVYPHWDCPSIAYRVFMARMC